MTNKIVKVFYGFGVIFWLGMLASAFFKLIGYNEIAQIFDIKRIHINTYTIEKDSVKKNSLDIIYHYTVAVEVFHKKLDVSQGYFDKNFEINSDSTIEICYNSTVPRLSYIASLSLEQRKQKSGVITSLIFLAFLSIIYFFGNLDKWIAGYKKA